MNNISKIGFLFFIILVVGLIIYSITTAEKFGDSYLEQLRIADAEKTLDNISDDISIEIGKLVCSETVSWINQESSIFDPPKDHCSFVTLALCWTHSRSRSHLE